VLCLSLTQAGDVMAEMQLALPVNHDVAEWHPDSTMCRLLINSPMSKHEVLTVLSSLFDSKLKAEQQKVLAEQQKVLAEQQKVLVQQKTAELLEFKLEEANMKLLVEKGRVTLRLLLEMILPRPSAQNPELGKTHPELKAWINSSQQGFVDSCKKEAKLSRYAEPTANILATKIKNLWTDACSECHPANANEFHHNFRGTALVPLENWLKNEEDILVMYWLLTHNHYRAALPACSSTQPERLPTTPPSAQQLTPSAPASAPAAAPATSYRNAAAGAGSA